MQFSPPSRWDAFYRLTGKATLGVLILFLGLGVVAFGFGRFLPSADDHYIGLVPSPSGHMKAAHITRSGGGGISPYCSESIAVVPTTAAEAEILREELEVYSSDDCDSFADHRLSPIIEWLSETRLRITFSTRRTAATMKSIKLKKQDASGRVAIEFVAHP